MAKQAEPHHRHGEPVEVGYSPANQVDVGRYGHYDAAGVFRISPEVLGELANARGVAELCNSLGNTVGYSVLVPADPAPTKDPSLDERAATAKALHPEWSDQQVADEVGCRRTTLFKQNMVAYRRVKAALKARRNDFRGDDRK